MHQPVLRSKDFLKFFFFLQVLIPLVATSQTTSWERVRIDGMVSVDLPGGSHPIDESLTLSLKVKDGNGSFAVLKKQQYGTTTRTLDDLSNFYKNYRDNYVDSTATILGGTAVALSGLRGYRFLYKATGTAGTQIGDVVVIIIKDVSYSFEFKCDEANQRKVKSITDRFFSSIAISYIQPAEQYTEFTSSRPVGEGFGNVLRYGGMLFVVLLGFVLWLLRTWPPVKMIRIVSACLLILAGTTELVLSIINKAIQKNHQSFVFFGYLYLLVGVVLLFLKLPLRSDED